MRITVVPLLLLSVLMCFRVVRSDRSSSAPDCVSKCWNNSQFVSACANEMKCLCEEAEFQNAVFQCLYSQCRTAQFGAALHHALSECSDYGSDSSTSAPRLLRHDTLHKRQDPRPRYASVSASASAIHSVRRRYVSATISASPLPTQNADSDSGPTYYIRKHRMVYATAAARTTPSGVLAAPTAMANMPML